MAAAPDSSAPARLTPAQRHAFAAALLGWTLDAFDYFLLTLSVTAIAAEFGATTGQVLEATFLTLAFRPVGAFFFGLLAEQYGRRRTLMLNVASFSTLGLLSAFAPTLPVFLLLRALFGVAMGGEWGVGAALAFETLPAGRRGLYSGILQQGYSAGSLLAAVSFGLLFGPLTRLGPGSHLGNLFGGWRGLFIFGAILPGLLLLYIHKYVEESPVWLSKRAAGPSRRGANGGAAEALAGLRRYGGTFFFLVLVMTGFNALSHGSTDIFPTFLAKDHHAGPHAIGLIGTLYSIGAILGGITFGALSERWGRKRAIVAAALLTVPSIPLYALSHSLPMLALGSFLVLFTVQGAWGVVPAYLNELSPAPVRAIFPGLVYQLGNLLASRISVAQAKAAVHVGSLGPVLAVSVLAAAVYLAGVVALGREPRGAALR